MLNAAVRLSARTTAASVRSQKAKFSNLVAEFREWREESPFLEIRLRDQLRVGLSSACLRIAELVSENSDLDAKADKTNVDCRAALAEVKAKHCKEIQMEMGNVVKATADADKHRADADKHKLAYDQATATHMVELDELKSTHQAAAGGLAVVERTMVSSASSIWAAEDDTAEQSAEEMRSSLLALRCEVLLLTRDADALRLWHNSQNDSTNVHFELASVRADVHRMGCAAARLGGAMQVAITSKDVAIQERDEVSVSLATASAGLVDAQQAERQSSQQLVAASTEVDTLKAEVIFLNGQQQQSEAGTIALRGSLAESREAEKQSSGQLVRACAEVGELEHELTELKNVLAQQQQAAVDEASSRSAENAFDGW
jgi:hypothetical protein